MENLGCYTSYIDSIFEKNIKGMKFIVKEDAV